MQFSQRINEIAQSAEAALAPIFAKIDAISFENTNRVMDAFREHRVAAPLWSSSRASSFPVSPA